MGFFSKIAESMSTGANATMSIRGVFTSYSDKTLSGTISYAGKTYNIKVRSKNLQDLFEVFPYNIPEIGSDVIFNVDSTKTYAIQVMPADSRLRGLDCRKLIK